ncbi:MAG: 3,4-dihydroxy-2-butanone-4-phosphate synthase [Planctomycetota bacterium]
MITSIPEILEDLRQGKMIILVDDERRENEGDLVVPAEMITPEIVNFMVTQARGYLCVALTAADCERMDLQPQTAFNTSLRGTPMTVTVDGHPMHGVGTGVSTHDRAATIRLLADARTGGNDFVRPGHIAPLRARDGGVLVRTGQTEGSVDLMKLAGLRPAAAIIEICRPDGEMARMPDLEKFSAEHGIRICTVEQIIDYRLEREALVQRLDPVEGTEIDTEHGRFKLIAYKSIVDPLPQLALCAGDVGRLDPQTGEPIEIDEPVLVRMHRRNLLGDIFGEKSNPSNKVLAASLGQIREEGRGALVYLRPTGIIGEGPLGRLQQLETPGDITFDVNRPNLHMFGTNNSNGQTPDPATVVNSVRAESGDGGSGGTNADHAAAAAATAAGAPGTGRSSGPTTQEDDGPAVEHRDFGIGVQILRDLGIRRLRVLTNSPKKMQHLEAFGLELAETVNIETQNT